MSNEKAKEKEDDKIVNLNEDSKTHTHDAAEFERLVNEQQSGK
jgi:hypothetical protein